MKRQAITVTIKQLEELVYELESQCRQQNLELDVVAHDKETKFQLNIINKTPEQCDTWEFE